jgi:malate synthase
MVHALASGANVYMADLEDSLAPTFANLIGAQATLRAAAEGTLSAHASDGRELRLPARPAVTMVRPRGWHLWETGVHVDNQPVPAALFDVALYVHHCARLQLREGAGVYLYLPKLEDAREARLWADVIDELERIEGLPGGVIRVTVLIETFPAVFQMDEILYALRSRATGLNLGRWDLLFSRARVTAGDASAILPDREALDMDQPFLAAVSRLLVDTAHRRGVHAMGGMAAEVPGRDPAANGRALDRVRLDKVREVGLGHDGTWVAHPALVPVARAVFDAHMKGPNQIHVARPAQPVRAIDLRAMPTGPRTLEGTRSAVRVAMQYLAAWLAGTGCVAIDGRMEDAATAEIARAVVWQRHRHAATLDEGVRIDTPRLRSLLDEAERTLAGGGHDGHLREARDLLERLTCAPSFPDFLTTEALARLGGVTERSPQPEEA